MVFEKKKERERNAHRRADRDASFVESARRLDIERNRHRDFRTRESTRSRLAWKNRPSTCSVSPLTQWRRVHTEKDMFDICVWL